MDFYFLLKIWVKTSGKNTSKSLSGKYSLGMLAIRQKLIDHTKQSATDALKTSSKRVIQNTEEATVILIGNKIANKEAMEVSKIYNRIIQRQLQMSMIKKYLKKNMYLQKKDKKLMMN